MSILITNEREVAPQRRKRRKTLVVASVVVLAWLLGRLPPSRGSRPEAWRNVWGTHETFPFRLVDGKELNGRAGTVVSRADWVVGHAGRTYVLYDSEPGEVGESMFQDVPEESLWIGLVGENGEILRKRLLARGVKNISGVRRGLFGISYVTASWKWVLPRFIPLRFPKPWPKVKTTGGAWERFQARTGQMLDRLWEDWPDNDSGYAADCVSHTYEELLEKEYDAAVDLLRKSEIAETCRMALAEEPKRTVLLAWEAAGDSSSTAFNVHWGNTMDRVSREQFMEPYVRNWLEGSDHPAGWATVCEARGVFRGEPFQATNGVALVGRRAWERRFDEEMTKMWGLIRLAPERVRETGGKTLIGFDLVFPQLMDSAREGGSGTFELGGDGTLTMVELETTWNIRWDDSPRSGE